MPVSCDPRRTTSVDDGRPSSSPYSYDCSKKAGRAPISDKLAAQVRAQLQQDGVCDRAGRPACSDLRLCGIVQLTEQTGLESCLHDDPVKPGVNGYCYIDGQQGNLDFVNQCPANRRQVVRLVPEGQTPTPDAIDYVSCGG